ncbi:hypothetical protein [Pseudomonas spirodelae]|uniref:Uncharacterized protein n=1 Tax=Pseudomonas spirodelae TaxID=3101751 RepID=A0ABU5P7W3_9PSED|nr:hypothetical protein [Pseudomonas sp. T5W1]MEA1605755.1 hypothetical protein [Pseudomonas sp. T5W1]
MEIGSEALRYVQAHWEWIFGSGGAVGALILIIKGVFSKQTIQQTQIIEGNGEAYQAGQDLSVTKKESAE